VQISSCGRLLNYHLADVQKAYITLDKLVGLLKYW